MSEAAKGKPTYGYKESTGQWSIHLGRLDATSMESLQATADAATRGFLDAFTDVCSVHSAAGVIAEIADDGRIREVWGEVPLEQQIDRSFRPVSEGGPADSSRHPVLASLTLRCDVLVQANEGGDPKTLESAMYFHYDSGLQTVIGENVKSGSAFASVAVEADLWLDAPLHGGRFLDNRITAALNRPSLERALHRWESALGEPISEASSVPYPGYVDRHGFRPGGQPDSPLLDWRV